MHREAGLDRSWQTSLDSSAPLFKKVVLANAQMLNTQLCAILIEVRGERMLFEYYSNYSLTSA